MRLTQTERDIIHNEVSKIFGDGAQVRLFGSRTNDSSLGGDIDLHIESISASSINAFEASNQLYVALIRQLGEQHIDIVTHKQGTPLRAIDKAAMKTGIIL